jgi:nucleotidyltransferase substrate binding protein (TIGR01987 family)
MTTNEDIRWKQRFENYKTALSRLEKLVELSTEHELDDVEQEALIQRFEYTQDLSWKVIKDFYESLGEVGVQGSRDAFQLAFNRGLIKNASAFMQSIKSRNDSLHTYNEAIAQQVYLDIVEVYYAAFIELKQALDIELMNRP